MAISMYHASVPTFLQLLGGLKGVIEKAEKHAAEKKWDEATVLNWRFYPDMFTFARQVRQASEHAFGAGRAAGVAVPELPAIDNSFAEMKSRIDKTIDFLKTLRPEQLDGKEEFTGDDYPGRSTAPIPRPGLSLSLGDAELLLPHDDCVQHPALARRRARQARFHGCDAVVSGVGFRISRVLPAEAG